MNKYLFQLLLLLGVLSSYNSYSKEVTIGFYSDLQPYVINIKDKITGVDVEIVRAAFASQGYLVKTKQYQDDKLYLAMQNGCVDGASVKVKPDGIDSYNDTFFYSNPYLGFNNLIITLKKNNLKIKSISDLKGISVIGWYKSYNALGNEFKKLYSPLIKNNQSNLYMQSINRLMQVKKFFSGKADSIVIDLYVFIWFKNQLLENGYTKANQPVEYHWIFPEQTRYQAAFKDESLRDVFNRGLEAVRKSGKIKEIEDRYLDCKNSKISNLSKECLIQENNIN